MLNDGARSIADAAAIAGLEQSWDALDSEHGGSAVEHPGSGVFVDDKLASLAGYERWGDKIAHVSVVTGPTFRGRGFGRDAVAHVAKRALEEGLLPQYRTLVSNEPSIRIAEKVRFQPYADSVAVRLESRVEVNR